MKNDQDKLSLLDILREQKAMKMKGGIVPFIITDELKMFYYRGLREWGHINGYLTGTCLTAQDQYKATLDYFRIKYRLESRTFDLP